LVSVGRTASAHFVETWIKGLDEQIWHQSLMSFIGERINTMLAKNIRMKLRYF